MKNLWLTLILAVVLLATISCIGIHDNGEPSGASPTLGQELIDLMKARDAGAVTGEEFRNLKSMLIEQYE